MDWSKERTVIVDVDAAREYKIGYSGIMQRCVDHQPYVAFHVDSTSFSSIPGLHSSNMCRNPHQRVSSSYNTM